MVYQVLSADSLDQRLQYYLPPDLYTRLMRTGAAPQHLLSQECQRLRERLAMVAAYLPYPLIKSQCMRKEAGQIAGTFWEGTLMVAELRGLAALADRLSVLGKQGAADVGAYLNQIFDTLAEDFHYYSGGLLGGGLLEFSGDLVMVFFDATVLSQHAVHAAHAALALHARIAAYTRIVTPMGELDLDVRIVLHSGRFFAAELGDANHIALVLSGAAAQEAMLLLNQAAPGDIVLSAATRPLLSVATLIEHDDGTALLQAVPQLPPQRNPSYWGWESGAGNVAELRLLVTRLDVLRPCLRFGMPESMLAPDIDLIALDNFCTTTALAIHISSLGQLVAHCADADTAALLLNAYYLRAQSIIHRYGGSVVRVSPTATGDLLLALFGALQPLEDDSLRTLRAALELKEALHDINTELASLLAAHQSATLQADRAVPQVALSQQIGICTGTIFAGPVGGARRRAFLTLGSTMQTARQLALAAGSNEVWLVASTRRLIERYVVTRNAPVILGDATAETNAVIVERLLAPGVDPLVQPGDHTPLIGRDSELQILLEHAALVRKGVGQVVALVGDAGSGKTRLIAEVIQRLNDDPSNCEGGFHAYTVECQSYEQHTPYAVVREVMRQFLRLAPGSDPRLMYNSCVEHLQTVVADLCRFAPVLSDVLGIVVEDTPLTAALTIVQRRERITELLVELLRLTASQPLILVVDDLHWADASSFDLLTRLLAVVPTLPVLLLISYRSTTLSAEPWRESGRMVALMDLSPEQSAALVSSLLGAAPPESLLRLLDQAQGNPLFIEELLWNLIHQGLLQHTEEGWQLYATFDVVALPTRIERVIAARLDRLSNVELEVVQAAAVIGRRFSRSLLAAIVTVPDRLPACLEVLEQNGFIRPASFGYIFRHTLLCDVVYERIPAARRRVLHRRLATRLVEMRDSSSDGRLELLARHTLLAEDWAASFSYHLAAGRKARHRHANHEALTLFETALAIVPRLNPVPREQLLELHERLGYVYALIGQDKVALTNFEQALALCKRGHGASSSEGLMRLHRHIAQIHERRADYVTAFAWLERALALASTAPSLELTRCLLLGAGIYQRQSHYQQSLEWAERALTMAEAIGSVREQAHAYKLLANVHGDMGNSSRAVELAERSLGFYSEIKDLQGQVDLHNNLGIFLYELGRWTKARVHYEAAVELNTAIGDIYQQAMVANNLGDVLRGLGDLDGALAQYQIAQRGWQVSPLGSGLVAMNLGATYLQRGDLHLSRQHFERSALLFAQANNESFLPELLRYRAELALLQGDEASALNYCTISLCHAVGLGARLEEGVTRRVMGQVLTKQGDLLAAERELETSLDILMSVDSRYEVARTMLALADLAPQMGQAQRGQEALTQAMATFRALSASLDIERARQVAGRWAMHWAESTS